MDIAYFDNAATTPMHPEAMEAMLPFYDVRFANSSGAHSMARDAMRAVNDARDKLAELFGAEDPGEVVFCGGATEADNLAILGIHGARQNQNSTTDFPSLENSTSGMATSGGATIVCSAIEHPAVLEPTRKLGGAFVGVDSSGVIDLEHLGEVIGPQTLLVSVMLVNNETGVIQPLSEVAEVLAARAPQALLHTDAVQAVSWLDVAKLTKPAQLVSYSAHKFGGPKGVGALIVRDGLVLQSPMLGGGHERDRRAGTHNVAGIAGMAAAAQISIERRQETVARVEKLRDQLADTIKATVPDTIETGVPASSVPASSADGAVGNGVAAEAPSATDRSRKVAGSCHFCFEGVEGEELLFLLEREGICASTASSCASGASEPSHVLSAMGYSDSLAKGALRLSLGHRTSLAEIELAAEVIPKVVAHLRSAKEGDRAGAPNVSFVRNESFSGNSSANHLAIPSESLSSAPSPPENTRTSKRKVASVS